MKETLTGDRLYVLTRYPAASSLLSNLQPLPRDVIVGEVDPFPQIEALVTQIQSLAGPQRRSFAYRAAKRSLDIVVSLMLIILLMPLLALIAVLIRLDSSGPVFFVDRRPGYLGKPFGMIKFRTMKTGLEREWGFDPSKTKDANDSRVTRVGRFLRSTSVDELPQLWNVLRGEMTLVGPRPEVAAWAAKYYQPWQYARLLVPQGMTGWWQVTGRSNKGMVQKTLDDIFYVERASFWLDLRIMIMTVPALFSRNGAH